MTCSGCGAGGGERHDETCPIPATLAATSEVLSASRAPARTPREARAVVALEKATRRALAAWLRAGETVDWIATETREAA